MEDEAVKAANENKGDEKEEHALYSEEYYAAQKAKRRGLGLIKFIGELFKLQMLTERIMHECVKKLQKQLAEEAGKKDDLEDGEIERASQRGSPNLLIPKLTSDHRLNLGNQPLPKITTPRDMRVHLLEPVLPSPWLCQYPYPWSMRPRCNGGTLLIMSLPQKALHTFLPGLLDV